MDTGKIFLGSPQPNTDLREDTERRAPQIYGSEKRIPTLLTVVDQTKVTLRTNVDNKDSWDSDISQRPEFKEMDKLECLPEKRKMEKYRRMLSEEKDKAKKEKITSLWRELAQKVAFK